MTRPIGRRLSRARVAEMIAFIMVKPRTSREIQFRMQVSRDTANGWVRALRATTPKCLYIHSYVWIRANGYRSPIYAWGNEPDAVKPGAQTSAQRVAKMRAKPALDRVWKHSLT